MDSPAVAAHRDLGIFPATFDGTALQNLANRMLSAGLPKISLNVSPLLLRGG
jgi:hypothetical protein